MIKLGGFENEMKGRFFRWIEHEELRKRGKKIYELIPQILINAYYAPGTLLDSEDRAENKTDEVPTLLDLPVPCRGTDGNKQHMSGSDSEVKLCLVRG